MTCIYYLVGGFNSSEKNMKVIYGNLKIVPNNQPAMKIQNQHHHHHHQQQQHEHEHEHAHGIAGIPTPSFPPSEALTMMGKPIFSARAQASSALVTIALLKMSSGMVPSWRTSPML